MSTSDPDRPAQQPHPSGAVEYPALENPNPYVPVGYPAGVGFPPLPGYYPTYDPYRAVKPPGTNGNAIAALVSAIGGLLCCGPLGIVGLVFGVIAIRETKRTGQDGYGLALAGAIIGGLALAGTVMVVVLYLALMVSGWQLV
ncbi:DUF4190 domain-containing protein [Mycobacterium neglectum]|jgi:hypothetical protein|uniref:DUF4190 domain-containing protein n=1 Tax=Mycobacterium neglectum TaxID=242737 RepID=UPI000BFEF252|nr:DUF4190 domain-containing protein [Mycobacterium neglectum]